MVKSKPSARSKVAAEPPAPPPPPFHRLVANGEPITVFDSVSVAQHFARPPDGLDAAVLRSLFVYTARRRNALHRYELDAGTLAATPALHEPRASSERMNQHRSNDDNNRPCQALSSDGRALYFLAYGPKMKSVELLALDPLSLEPLRAPVKLGGFQQFDCNPLLPGGAGHVVAQVALPKRDAMMHLLDATTGAARASLEGGRHWRAWHMAGDDAPYVLDATDAGVRVFSLADHSFESIATIPSSSEVLMLDVGPCELDGAFAALTLTIDEDEQPVLRRYIVRPTAARTRRFELAGEYRAEDVMFATFLPRSIALTFDGRVVAVVGGNVATSGVWTWSAPGRAKKSNLVACDAGEDGRLFRVAHGHGAVLTESGEIVLPSRAKR